MLSVKTKKGLSNLLDAKIIREAVFIKEQGFQNEWDDIDSQAFHTVVYYDENPIATGRAFKIDNKYHIGRVAVLPSFRRKNIGNLVMKTLEAQIKCSGADTVELSSQVRAKEFYMSQGYHAFGEEYLDEFCPHIRLYFGMKIKYLYDCRHLSAVFLSFFFSLSLSR